MASDTQDTRRVMIDIETVGLQREAAILEIGAAQFAPRGLIGETFYSSVSITSSQEAGLTIDADTIEWWVGENSEIAGDVLVGGDSLEDALSELVDWYNDIEPHEVWANSPSFDCEILEYAGEQVGVSMPWEFYQERDVRTLDSLPHAVEIEQDGTEHNALDDALYQARLASAILTQLSGARESSGSGGDGP